MQREREIIETLERVHRGRIFELRALDVPDDHRKPMGRRSTWAGYYDDYAAAARAAIWLDDVKKAGGVYMTINEVHPGCICRAPNVLIENLKPTTSDSDIVGRRWLLIDIDPKRPAGISSTDEELAIAIRTRDALATLPRFRGLTKLRAVSGNGAHLLIDAGVLSNDAARELLLDLNAGYSDDAVGVDLMTFNLARITRLYGTTARKGFAYRDRPHRRSYLENEV